MKTRIIKRKKGTTIYPVLKKSKDDIYVLFTFLNTGTMVRDGNGLTFSIGHFASNWSEELFTETDDIIEVMN